MAIKANASSNGSSDFKKYVGVASFKVCGVNPTKEELEKFYGREMSSAPEYLKDKTDANNGDKPYKQLRVSFMIQADPKDEDGKVIEANKALTEPLKLTANFFIDSRYNIGTESGKVQVIDKYGRTAWVTVEQAKNHQIPVYKNGPAKIDANYRPSYKGEEELIKFMRDYLNVTPIDSYNKNTGEWMTNPHPEDCEGNFEHIQSYFEGDISELKEFCSLMPNNRVKLCVGVQTDNEGRQFMTVSRFSMRNGARSYTPLKDYVDRNNSNGNTVFSDDPAGVIMPIHEYVEKVTETDFSSENPFASAASELPFGETSSDDPFANM